MDKARLDTVADAIIADAESHMEWIDGRHLRTKKDIEFFAGLIGGHMEKVADDDRAQVLERLVLFARCLESEFDSPAVGKTFLAGLKVAVDEPLPVPEEPHPTEKWTFKTKPRGGIKFQRHLKVREPGGGTIGA